ncbi:hypothetical protein [Synechococcus sp. PCC 7336]|uniref:c-type cytochrome n=1 Tax=Synechococcus sp. PCC 7336 TaxID=195250 RepID=UPI0003453C09|nr:hypothetical protein [Synechococcus sp. PCC 7336]
MAIFSGKFGKNLTAIGLVVVLFLGTLVGVGWFKFLREVPTFYASPEQHFNYGSIGAEARDGMPYWMWLVLPRLFPEYLPGPGGYASLGISWEPGEELPIGFSKKVIGFPRQGITCAVCHTATYRNSPEENPTFVYTGPSSRFNLQGYINFLRSSARDPRFNADYILNSSNGISYVAGLSWLDKQLYRFLIIPITKTILLNFDESFSWMDVRPDQGPGRIAPFNPVKFRILGLPIDDTIGNSDMMPLWNEQQHEGFALHWDGLETSLTETALEGALGDGATQKSLDVEGIARVEDYIRKVPPPAYPYAIDTQLAETGSLIFENSCASCHAFGGERTGTVIPVEEIGTDRHRLDMWTQEAVDAYKAYSEGYDWEFTEIRKTNGYVSVALDGLWLRSPYLHNGSVPSLVDLFESPENRPTEFYRGYDVYDPVKMGFISTGPEAEKAGFRYDTSLPANSNQGHVYGTDLSTQDKTALIEYLKML